MLSIFHWTFVVFFIPLSSDIWPCVFQRTRCLHLPLPLLPLLSPPGPHAPTLPPVLPSPCAPFPLVLVVQQVLTLQLHPWCFLLARSPWFPLATARELHIDQHLPHLELRSLRSSPWLPREPCLACLTVRRLLVPRHICLRIPQPLRRCPLARLLLEVLPSRLARERLLSHPAPIPIP
jgi:hypothetical protein